MINIANLQKSFNGNKILDDVNLCIEENESCVVLGRSGSGKSVLIKIIVGLLSKDGGTVSIDNSNVINHSFVTTKNNCIFDRLGFLFQSSALFDSLKVWENITFYVRQKNLLSISQARELTKSKLNQVGLNQSIIDYYPSELSGGMQKRVALARAIAHDPNIIFFDEPTTGLDPVMSNIINNLILKIKQDLKATTITITHDINSAKVIADTIAFLRDGQIRFRGKREDLFSSSNMELNDFINGVV